MLVLGRAESHEIVNTIRIYPSAAEPLALLSQQGNSFFPDRSKSLPATGNRGEHVVQLQVILHRRLLLVAVCKGRIVRRSVRGCSHGTTER
jgi:hypothetical protein